METIFIWIPEEYNLYEFDNKSLIVNKEINYENVIK